MKVGNTLPYDELQIKFVTSKIKIKHIHGQIHGRSDSSFSLFQKFSEMLVADLNLFGTVGTYIAFAIISVWLLYKLFDICACKGSRESNKTHPDKRKDV